MCTYTTFYLWVYAKLAIGFTILTMKDFIIYKRKLEHDWKLITYLSHDHLPHTNQWQWWPARDGRCKTWPSCVSTLWLAEQWNDLAHLCSTFCSNFFRSCRSWTYVTAQILLHHCSLVHFQECVLTKCFMPCIGLILALLSHCVLVNLTKHVCMSKSITCLCCSLVVLCKQKQRHCLSSCLFVGLSQHEHNTFVTMFA